MESLHISFVSPGFAAAESYPNLTTGIESQIYLLAVQLQKLGHTVDIYRRGKPTPSLDSKVPLVSIELPNLRDNLIGEIPSRLAFSRRAALLLMQDRPDIVHLSERFSGFYPGTEPSLVRVFATHNPDAMRFYRRFAWSYNPANLIAFDLKRILEERIIRSANAVFAPNEELRSYVENVGARKTAVVANGVDAGQFSSGPEEDYVLFAGRIDRVKGVDILLRAFDHVAANFDTELQMVGDGRDRGQAMKLARKLGIAERVHFTPNVSKSVLAGLMSRCKLFVLPSRFEIFGNVLVEAMASSRAVVASLTIGARSIIEDGVDGLLVPCADVVSLSAAIEKLLSNSEARRLLGVAARKKVEDRYDFARIAADAEKAYVAVP